MALIQETLPKKRLSKSAIVTCSTLNAKHASKTLVLIMFSFTLDIYCTSVRPRRGIPHMWLSEVSTFFLPVKRFFQ